MQDQEKQVCAGFRGKSKKMRSGGRPLRLAAGAAAVVGMLAVSSPVTGAATLPRAMSSAQKKASEPLIGFAVSRTSVPFFLAMEKGVEVGAKRFGARVVIDNANNSATTQSDQIRTMLNEGVNALIINAVDLAAVIPMTELAAKDHVPVVAPGTGIPGGKVYMVVDSNPYTIGRMQADGLAGMLTKRYGKPAGDIVYAEGIMTLAAGQREAVGFLNELKKRYPLIRVVDTIQGEFAETPAYDAMRAVLAAHPAKSGQNAIVAAVGANDASAEGMARAIEGAGRYFPPTNREHIFVIGADGGPTGVPDLRAGQLDLIVGQHPDWMGYLSVKFALQAIKGVKAPKNQHYYTPLTAVDRSNLDKVQIWGKTWPRIVIPSRLESLGQS